MLFRYCKQTAALALVGGLIACGNDSTELASQNQASSGVDDEGDDASQESPSCGDIMERFAGRYENPVTAPGNGTECPPEADAVLHVEVASVLEESELLGRECGTTPLPVTVEFTTDDGKLKVTEQGWLTKDDVLDVGSVRIDEPSFGGGEVFLELDPEARSVSSNVPVVDYRTFDACCLELPSRSLPELLQLDELGLIELDGIPEVLGQDTVLLELRVTSEPLSNSCFETHKREQPINFELLDAEGAVVATGSGHADGVGCSARPSCMWVRVYGDGQVSNASYLGAAEPLTGEASRIFLEANFLSCEAPALVELGISVDVQLEDRAIEMGLNPVPSSGISRTTELPPDQCF